MKNYLIACFICSAFFCYDNCHGQNPDPLSFFPHHLDDYWEYQFYLPDCTPDYGTYQRVVLDSLLPDSNYLVHFSPSQIPGSEFLINTSTFEVMSPSPIDTTIIYKLDSQLGEWWYIDYEDSLNYITARVIDVYNSSIFGNPTTIKVIDFWGYNLPDSIWLVRDHLASDFGFIRQDVEGGCFNGNQRMYCSIIDSIQFGNCIYSSITDDPIEKSLNGFLLYQNFPNPFNNITKITYNLPRSVFVNLSIYTITGQKIITLIDRVQQQGVHSIAWEGRDRYGRVVGSGVYIYTLNAGAYKESNKMILMK